MGAVEDEMLVEKMAKEFQANGDSRGKEKYEHLMSGKDKPVSCQCLGYVAGALEADSCGLGSQLIVFASCVTVRTLAPRSELHLLCTQNWGNPVLSHGSWENGMRNRM